MAKGYGFRKDNPMTVADIISIFEKLPPDMKVHIAFSHAFEMFCKEIEIDIENNKCVLTKGEG